MPDLVITLVGPDRPGIVEAVAAPIAANGGNWLESRMAHLAGKFAGILRIEVPSDRSASVIRALEALQDRGLRVVVEQSAGGEVPDLRQLMALDLVGTDRPGIVRELSHLFAEHGVNIEELTTDRTHAPMSAEMLFRARAQVRVPPGTKVDDLRARLERLASDLMVEVRLVDAEGDEA